MTRPITFVLLLLGGGAAGFVIGRSTVQRESLVRHTPRAIVTPAAVPQDRLPSPEPSPVSFDARPRRPGEAPLNAQSLDDTMRQLVAWAAVDPRAALGYVRANFKRDRQEKIVPALLSAWAEKDPRAAWVWATTEAPADLTALTLIDAVLSVSGKTAPDLAWTCATEFARQHPYDAQSAYVSALRGILYTGNYETATRLVRDASLPTGEGRYDLTSLIVSEWGRYEPEKTAAWLLTLPDGIDRRQGLVSLGQSWAEVDAQQAADFAASLPAGQERQSMLSTAVDRWAIEHPGQVGEWLVRYQQHPDFDQVVAAVASSQDVIGRDPRLAITWADTIIDYDVRLQTLATIMDRWITRDDDAAKKFLRSSPELSPETRTDLRQRLRLGE